MSCLYFPEEISTVATTILEKVTPLAITHRAYANTSTVSSRRVDAVRQSQHSWSLLTDSVVYVPALQVPVPIGLLDHDYLS